MCTAAVLDWNGTTINDLPLVYKSVVEIFRRYGLPPPALKQYREEMTQEWMKFYLSHGIPEGTTPDELNAIRREVLEANWNSVTLHEGALEFLQLLRMGGATIVLVSGEVREILDARIAQFGIGQYYDRVIGGAYRKTELLATLGFDPEKTIYVDDDSSALCGAKELGFRTIGMTHGYASTRRIRSAEPDCVAKNFNEAIAFVSA